MTGSGGGDGGRVRFAEADLEGLWRKKKRRREERKKRRR